MKQERSRLDVTLWILTCGTVLSGSILARAADRESIQEHLHVRRGITCLNVKTLASELEQRLEAALIPRDLTFDVIGSETDPRSLELQVIRGGQRVARRDFTPAPKDCRVQHVVVALAIALMIKGEARQTSKLEPLRPARGWSLAGAGFVAHRLLPGIAPGIELSVQRALTGQLELRVAAIAAGTLGAELPQQQGSFDAGLIGLRTEACARAALAGPVTGALCVGALSAALLTVGVDVADAARAAVPYIALSGALAVELELTEHWSLLGALSPFYLLHAVHVGLTDAHGTPAISAAFPRLSGSLALGTSYSF